ncbi:hypothetical protein QVD17_16356 [Tagetes erecta]|uniref:LisH domain-containing protein n=1 Tax=Tagetes erecta TaxID=13708 RepID=A0AAD8KQR8_TARER|nr:hypothetical protein QVD17_16356 [Tagetes erecta]
MKVFSCIMSCYFKESIKLRTREEWEKKLNDVKFRKEDMIKLVMSFLVIEGYVDATEKFRLESVGMRAFVSFDTKHMTTNRNFDTLLNILQGDAIKVTVDLLKIGKRATGELLYKSYSSMMSAKERMGMLMHGDIAQMF